MNFVINTPIHITIHLWECNNLHVVPYFSSYEFVNDLDNFLRLPNWHDPDQGGFFSNRRYSRKGHYGRRRLYIQPFIWDREVIFQNGICFRRP